LFALTLISGAIIGWGASLTRAGVGPGAPGATDSVANPETVKVDLSRLLKLPDSFQRPVENRAGVGKHKWRGRFERVQADLVEAEQALASAKEELGEIALGTGGYAVAAPGTTIRPEDTPLSYKLRQEIRRQRERVDRAEHRMRELSVEADLADVPSEWRLPDEVRSQPR